MENKAPGKRSARKGVKQLEILGYQDCRHTRPVE
jgi:hypothetical protein